jgi:predicted esterase
MAHRNFSMVDYFNRVAKDWKPLLSFAGTSETEFEDWQARASEKFFELLGDFPEPVAPEPEVIFSIEDRGLIRERVIFDADEFMSVPCTVLRPVDMKADGTNAAILCSHGHGAYGKDPVAGNATTADKAASIAAHQYNYGEIMARAGYLTISPDLRVFGERSDGGNPYPGRDKCNVHFIRGAMLGIYTLTLNIWDMKCCVDYLQSRAEVDPERIGMMGLSQGGTMTTFATAAEPRIKCADIIGYLNPWERFGVNRANFCGSQIVPGIFRYFDTHDIAGLICPRPLLVEMGVHDTCFFIEDQLCSFRALEKIYQAAGAAEDLWSDTHPGEHGFANNKAHEFFARYL